MKHVCNIVRISVVVVTTRKSGGGHRDPILLRRMRAQVALGWCRLGLSLVGCIPEGSCADIQLFRIPWPPFDLYDPSKYSVHCFGWISFFRKMHSGTFLRVEFHLPVIFPSFKCLQVILECNCVFLPVNTTVQNAVVSKKSYW